MRSGLPDNELERLSILHQLGILDSESEKLFDNFVELASQICGTPMSAITLVAETRQWFKAQKGFVGRETTRELSFCSHAILNPQSVLVVPDTTTDERFNDNSSVTADPHIRFYAGAPLLTRSGHALGTLCVIDTMPKELTQSQLDALQTLAREIVLHIELRAKTKTAEEIAQRFELAVQGTQDGIWDWNVLSGSVFYSERFKKLLGFPLNDVDNNFAEFKARIHPIDQHVVMTALHCHLKDQVPFKVECRLKAKDEEYRWFQVSGDSRRDENGFPMRMTGSLQDIQDRKQIEQQLAQERAHLVEAQRTAKLGSWKYVIHSQCITWSDEVYRMFELDKSKGPPSFEEHSRQIHPEDHATWSSSIDECVKNSAPYEIEFRAVMLNGDVKHMFAKGISNRGDNGEISYLSGIVQDVTKQARDRIALQEAQLKAEEASMAKTRFLANMSHEIRTPLTSIIGFSEAILAEELTGEERDNALHSVLRNGKHLLSVISDILDISKVEAGKLEIERIPISLHELVTDVGNLMSQRAAEKGISCAFDLEIPAPRIIVSDPTRLKQVLINLIGNAIKFTHQGGVKTRIIFDRKEELLTFDIIDTGIGISDEQKAKLFQAFCQADTSTTRQFGGSGLGLIISRELAVSLGGDITVDSVHGRGSVFTLTVSTGPVKETDIVYNKQDLVIRKSVPSAPKKAPTFTGSILVVEDGPDNQNYLSFILKKTGAEITIVENGALAVMAVENRPFDLILMDMQMPVMDGLTATRILRAQGCTTPVIALTANTMKEDVERYRTAGCDQFIGKPFERTALLQLIEFYMNRSMQDGPDEQLDEEMQSIIQSFERNLPQRLDQIYDALEKKDWETLKMLAHRMRGAKMFGHVQLGEIAGALEFALNEHNEAIAVELVNELERVALAVGHHDEGMTH